MWHLTAYRSTITAGATAQSLAIIPGSADFINAQNQYFPQVDMSLLFAVGFGTDLDNPRISSPTLRNFGPQYVRPWSTVTPLGSNFPVAQWANGPAILRRLNAIDVQAGNTNAADQAGTVLLGLGVPPLPRVPNGDRRTLRWTGATTAVANTWTTVVPIVPDTLPMGVYHVAGLQAFGATMYACRMIFQGANNQYRPGIPTVQAVGQRAPFELDFLRDYSWGQFTETTTPNFEILCTAADTAQEFWIDLIKVA